MKKLILFLSIIFNGLVYGQGKTNLFHGGYENYFGSIPFGGNKVDFNSGLPVVGQEFRAIDYDFTGTNITDSLGNLLFATNGVIIMNNANDTMVNGKALNPSQYTTNFSAGLRLIQPAIILQGLNNPDEYFLFHMTLDQMSPNSQSNNFYYSKIDMSMNGGAGQVIIKNHVLKTGIFYPNRLTACKHANGRDWWIVLVELNGSNFYFFLLTPNGPIFKHTQSIGGRVGTGQACFSPDGSKYGSYSTDDDYFEIFNFDRCAGLFSNYRQVAINDSMVSAGAAFSPNSRYLYGSSSVYLYQVDASSNQPDTTLTTVAVWDGTYSPNPPLATLFYMQQLAQDGKIYLTTGNSTLALHVIDAPDSSGTNCNVFQHAVSLPTYNVTVPNHPNYNLGPLIGSGCDTLTTVNEMYATKPLQLSVYPNPVVTDHFEINYSLEQNKVGYLEILKATGQLVFAKTLPQWSSYQKLELPQLENGIYLMRLKSGNKTASFKFVKNKIR